jgi:ribosomal protein L16/L10AE
MKQKRPYIYNSKSRQVKAEIISLRKNSFIHRSLEKGIVSREALEAARRAVKKVLKKKPFLTKMCGLSSNYIKTFRSKDG